MTLSVTPIPTFPRRGGRGYKLSITPILTFPLDGGRDWAS